MPPTTAAPSVSLRELADLAIGTPEVGVVNFTALHTLIVAMLKNLNLQDTRIDFPSPMLEQSRLFESPRLSSGRAQPQALESQVKDLGGQVQDLSLQLTTMGSQVQAIVAHVEHFPSQAGGLDARDWLEVKDLPLLMQGKAQVGSTVVRKDGELVPQVGAQAVRPSPRPGRSAAPPGAEPRRRTWGRRPEPGGVAGPRPACGLGPRGAARALRFRAWSCSRTSWKT